MLLRLGNSYKDWEVDRVSSSNRVSKKHITLKLKFKLDKKSLKFPKKKLMLLRFRWKIDKSLFSEIILKLGNLSKEIKDVSNF